MLRSESLGHLPVYAEMLAALVPLKGLQEPHLVLWHLVARLERHVKGTLLRPLLYQLPALSQRGLQYSIAQLFLSLFHELMEPVA